MGLEQEELIGSVIGAAIEVHKALGPGFLESVCENKRVIGSQRPDHDFLASWLPGFLSGPLCRFSRRPAEGSKMSCGQSPTETSNSGK